jgi:hypothetical protein
MSDEQDDWLLDGLASDSDPPEGYEGKSYWPRPCLDHWHVTVGGMDLIGGKCDTEEEAAEMCRRLNEGEDLEEVLGNWMETVLSYFQQEDE